MWAEVGKGQLIGPELLQETTEKISQIKDRLKAARNRQKSYNDMRRKSLEFSVEPVNFLDREIKKLKRSRIVTVKFIQILYRVDDDDFYENCGIPTGSDEFPLPEQLPTAYEDKFPLLIQSDATVKKIALLVKSRNNYFRKDSYCRIMYKTPCPIKGVLRNGSTKPHPCQNPNLDTGKFEQWQFRIQEYLQHEHYALWEVIKFGDSYEAPKEDAATASTTDGSTKKKGRTVVVTTEDMQKRKNDVKARTTLLLSLPDEHQLRFSKYKTAQELWAAILKTFGGNKATKKTKKNLLKQQYKNFKAKGT
uniref:Reverse transcriptase domain-containing protein n=1 Tax=Tanacetum cinerariifolium TaxID=118510 RepID=A0A699J3Z4_TANCI|nr:reverse transcriptase domain-containing protein [Tanacetum cinerariifolium]